MCRYSTNFFLYAEHTIALHRAVKRKCTSPVGGSLRDEHPLQRLFRVDRVFSRGIDRNAARLSRLLSAHRSRRLGTPTISRSLSNFFPLELSRVIFDQFLLFASHRSRPFSPSPARPTVLVSLSTMISRPRSLLFATLSFTSCFFFYR